MDAKAHLDSYRESLKRDALEGCVEYARMTPTANPARFPTIFDYIKYTLEAASYHSENDDARSYKLWLEKHQEAMVLMFERMVDELLFGADTATADQLLALVHEYGWNWFKFSKRALTFKMTFKDEDKTGITVVPRVTVESRRPQKHREAIFDADEMRTLIAIGDKTLARQVLEYKTDFRVKFMGLDVLEREAKVSYRDLDKINGDRVFDWAAPLWQGDSK